MGAVNPGGPAPVIRSRMQVEKVMGPHKRIVRRVQAEKVVKTLGNGIQRESVISKYEDIEEEVAFGYMCYFPSGHSVFIFGDDTAKIERYGINKPVIAVDMATGEQYNDPLQLPATPKEIVEATTNRNRGRTSVAA